MKALDRNHVIAWLKSEAKKLLDAAEALDGNSTAHNGVGRRGAMKERLIVKRIFNLEMMKRRISQHGARVSDVAKYFGVRPEQVQAFVDDPSSGIRVAARGWLKIRNENEKAESDSLGLS